MNFAAFRSAHHSDVSRDVKNAFVKTLRIKAVKIMLWALETFQIVRSAANAHIIKEEIALSPKEPMVSNSILVKVRCLICGRFDCPESVAENRDTEVC